MFGKIIFFTNNVSRYLWTESHMNYVQLVWYFEYFEMRKWCENCSSSFLPFYLSNNRFELTETCKFIWDGRHKNSVSKNGNSVPFEYVYFLYSEDWSCELILLRERRLNLYSELRARVPISPRPVILIISVEPFIPGIGLIKRGCGTGKMTMSISI